VKRSSLPRFVKDRLHKILQSFPEIKKIVALIHDAGGRVLLVGGAVRDLFLKELPKDIDIEVHGVKIDDLQKILKKMGNVSLVGKSFGVLRLNGLDVDWSVPRKDSKGRKPEVVIDPQMSVEEAFRRRDLTMNALGIDLDTQELIDPFDGLQDLEDRVLRVPDKELFVEDPLRFFRVMQFIGRFEMEPDDELNEICKKMDLSKISRERIEEEFNKLFLKSKRPSLGIDWLRKIGRLKEILPEVYDLIGVEQDKKWHPEGDAYVHTLQVLDAMAEVLGGPSTPAQDDRGKMANTSGCLSEMSKPGQAGGFLPEMYRPVQQDAGGQAGSLWAALCHDLGKPATSKAWGDGRISAYGHEQAGLKPTKKLLKRFTRDKELVDGVCKLVEHHMQPGQFIKNKAKPSAYKRLAHKLAPQITLEELALFACADKLGRNPKQNYSESSVPHSYKEAKKYCKDEFKFVDKAKKLNVLDRVEKPVLQGRDLMGEVEPGPEMGRLVKKAYEIQIEEGIKNKRELKKRVLS